MGGGTAIRGSRVGAGPVREPARGEAAPRVQISYWCANGHHTEPSFALDEDIEVPEFWDCKRCGLPAGRDPLNPPEPPRNTPYKTHLDYVKERRSDEEGKALLDEALTMLRKRRGEA